MNKNPMVERDLGAFTFVREQIKPPAKEGMDATKIRTHKGAEIIVKFKMPQIDLDDMTAPDLPLPFKHGKMNGVDVHFHDGFVPKAGETYTVKAELFMKTVERCNPDGSELKQGWRNYYYFLDLRLTEDVATKELVVHDTSDPDYTGSGRTYPDQIFDGHFCHLSGDKKRNTHIQFKPIRSTETAFAQAFADRRPRRTVAAG